MDPTYLKGLKQRLTEPWERKVLDWCEAHGIYDVRPYTGDGNEWNLIWPSEGANQQKTIIRQINFSNEESRFIGYSGVFMRKRRSHEPVLSKYGERRTFSESELLPTLSALKEYAEKLTEHDLAHSEE